MANRNKVLILLQKQLLKSFKEKLKIVQFSCPSNIVLLILFLPGKKKVWKLFIQESKQTIGGDDSLVCNINYTFTTSDNWQSRFCFPFKGKPFQIQIDRHILESKTKTFLFLLSGGKKREEKGSIGIELISPYSSILKIPFGIYQKQCYETIKFFHSIQFH